MGPERALAAVEPTLRACAAEGAALSPTTLSVRLSVAPDGAVESVEPASTPVPPLALVVCVVKAVRAAHFGAPGAAGASIILPLTILARSALSTPDAATAATDGEPPAKEPTAQPTAPETDDPARPVEVVVTKL